MEKRKPTVNPHQKTGDAETTIITYVTAALMAKPPHQITIIEAAHNEQTDTVVLAGEVEDQRTREAVERIAAQYPGVSAVVNTLAIGPRRLPPPADEARHVDYDVHVASVPRNTGEKKTVLESVKGEK